MADNIEKLAALKEQLSYLEVEQEIIKKKTGKRDGILNAKMRDLMAQIKKLKTRKLKSPKKKKKGMTLKDKDKEFHILRVRNRLSILQNLITINLSSERPMDKQDIKSAEEVINICMKESKESLSKIIYYKKKEVSHVE